jgi:hypothetical protein
MKEERSEEESSQEKRSEEERSDEESSLEKRSEVESSFLIYYNNFFLKHVLTNYLHLIRLF